MRGDGIEILECAQAGYSKEIRFNAWRVAIINYAERFDIKNIDKLERHLLTDEVFVLLSGSAKLFSESNEYEMEKGKLYNVKAASWHAICVSCDAKVLIVENDDTGVENTEYKRISRRN